MFPQTQRLARAFPACSPAPCLLVLPQPHIWGLDRQLDKFTTDYVQQHLQRGSHGLLNLSEMDFAFPPNVSPAMIVQGRLKGHQSVSSAGLAPVQFGAKQAPSKQSKLPGGIGWLREVRHLQDPNPRLHNMPEVSWAHWVDDQGRQHGTSPAIAPVGLVYHCTLVPHGMMPGGCIRKLPAAVFSVLPTA